MKSDGSIGASRPPFAHALALNFILRFQLYPYVGRLLEKSRHAPDLIEIKLADRLDNTLGMRIDLHDPIEDVDFFQTIFQILFVNNFPEYKPKSVPPTSAALNGCKRLYQLLKTPPSYSSVF
jgi:hypothetical protein